MTEYNITSFHNLLALKPTSDDFSAFISEDWAQGRSTFGGLSAALCLQACFDQYPDLPPLRSAQVSFVGPSLGEVSVKTEVLRQGRNVTFLQADLVGEKGLATRCVFSFGANRESAFHRDDLEPIALPSPEESVDFFPKRNGPNFTRHHIEQRLAAGHRPVSNADDADNWIWVRLRDWQKTDGISALLTMADAVPPSEMSCFSTPANVSSMTWLINFLTDTPQTREGWWLIHAKAEHSANGYSSQDMIGWNRDGVPMFTARQSIAIFA